MSYPPVSEVQTPSGALTPSIIRTSVPLIIGLLTTWLVDALGANIDTVTAGALITAFASWVYYTVARFLEVYASPKWGYILGIGRLPVYADKAPPVTVQVPAESSRRNDAGSADLGYVLVALGLVLIVLALFTPLPPWLWVVGLLCLVVGAVLMLTARSRHRL